MFQAEIFEGTLTLCWMLLEKTWLLLGTENGYMTSRITHLLRLVLKSQRYKQHFFLISHWLLYILKLYSIIFQLFGKLNRIELLFIDQISPKNISRIDTIKRIIESIDLSTIIPWLCDIQIEIVSLGQTEL